MRHLRRSLTFLALALLSGARADDIPLTVAMVYPTNDPRYLTGVEAQEGAKLALEESRATFARLGFDLKMAIFDDKRTADEGRRVAAKLLEDPSVLVVVGPMNSAVTLAVSEVLAPANLALISPKSTNPLVTERNMANVNRIVARDDAQAQAAVDFLVSTMGARSAVVMDDTSTYGKGLYNQFRAAAEEKNLRLLGYFSEKTDFARVLAEIQKDKPDVIYYAGTADVGVPLLKAIRAAKLDVVFMGADGIDNDQFRQGAGRDAVGVYHTGVAAPPAAYPRARSFVTTFRRAYQKDPDANQLLGYDAMKVALTALQDAIRRGGGDKPSREAVMRAVRSVQVRGLTGDLRFNSAGDRLGASMFVLQIGENLVSRVSGSFPVVLARR